MSERGIDFLARCMSREESIVRVYKEILRKRLSASPSHPSETEKETK